jgi:predicted DNA-binding transcriptional regulator YafY
MFSGEMIKVHIRCKKRILDAMIDIFGTDLILIDRDPLYYEFSVEVNENGVLYLAQQFLDAVEILSPSYIRRRIRDNLCKAYTMYLS